MDQDNGSSLGISRRKALWLSMGLAAGAIATSAAPRQAQARGDDFAHWVDAFRAQARARGVSDATYTLVMHGLKPDTEVFELQRDQPEFGEKLWQYLNRRVSDWRIESGKEKAKEYAALLSRIEQDVGVDHSVMLGIWGGLRGPRRPEESYAAHFSRARGACLGRTAPPPLLGTGAAQCARDRRAWLEHA